MSQLIHVRAFRDLVGEEGVVDDPERMATYTTDQRQLSTGSAFAVLKPRATNQVADIVRLAAYHGIGIVPQGGNTSYCGGATPDASGRQIIVSLERMDRIREIDPVSMSISVDAGAILKNVQDAAAAAGLLLPLSLGAEGSCRIGGNIGTNAGGLSVVKYGMTRDLLLGIEAVLADGTVVSDMRKLRKNNTGYDVKQCFVGSEGTLGIVTGAVLRLAPLPIRRATAWLKLASGAPLAELLALVRRESADLLTTFEFMAARSIALAASNDRPARPFSGSSRRRPRRVHLFLTPSRSRRTDGSRSGRGDRVRMDRGRIAGAERIAAGRDVAAPRDDPRGREAPERIGQARHLGTAFLHSALPRSGRLAGAIV